MNIGVCVSFKIRAPSFLHICPEVELIHHKVALFLTFLKPSNSITLCFSANVINDCKSWQTGLSFLKKSACLKGVLFL